MITRVSQSVMLLTDILIFTFVRFSQLTEPIPIIKFCWQILQPGRVFDKLALRGITWYISWGLLCSLNNTSIYEISNICKRPAKQRFVR